MTRLHMHSIASLALLLSIGTALAAAPQDSAEGARPGTAARLDPAAIDRYFAAAWKTAGVVPQESATDADWLRRASLALNGVIPSAEEMEHFLRDTSPDKRERKVDDLLARPEFAEHTGGEWTRFLIGRQTQRNRFDREAFESWVVEQFALNTPFHTFAEKLLTASGTQEQNPASGFFLRYESQPKEVAAPVSKVFLGVDIQCARCHDHKYEQWKQHEFNEFAAYFANTEQRRANDRSEPRPEFEVLERPDTKLAGYLKKNTAKRLEERAKNIKNPEVVERMKERADVTLATPTPLRPLESGIFATPMPSSEAEVSFAKPATRRAALVQWMTAPGNPYFARAVTNRIAAMIFGYGITMPIDDFRSDSTLAIPGLLDALAVEFERSGYNYREMVGLLAKTKAFGLSSGEGVPQKPEQLDEEAKIFARYPARPMSPEQLFDSLTRATGIDEAAEKRAKTMKEVGKRVGKKAMSGEAAAQMYGKLRDQALRRFISTFDDDEQGESIDFEGTIPQALMMMNSKIVSESMQRGLTLTRALEKASGNDRIDALYLAALSRKPSTDERMKALAYIQKNGDKRESFEDLLWALLNSAEFATVH